MDQLDERWARALGGRFQPIRVLDAGGRAAVVLARYIDLDRLVALRIAPWPPGTEGASFIEDEARTLAQLHHPGIARILDFGHSGGFSWIAFEYIEAQDVGTLVASGGFLPLNLAVQTAIAVAETLELAHESGYLHRLLTARKVFLAADRSVKVLGFGGGKVEPEGVRADVAALARLLAESAGGSQLAHRLKDVLLPKQLTWLENLLKKARLESAESYASVKELREDLEVFLDFVPPDPLPGEEHDAFSRPMARPVEIEGPTRETKMPGIDLLGKKERRPEPGGDDLDLGPILVRGAYATFPVTAAVLGCYMLHEEVSVARTLLVLALLVCCFLLVVNIWSEEEK